MPLCALLAPLLRLGAVVSRMGSAVGFRLGCDVLWMGRDQASSQAVPEVAFGEEALDLVQLDLGVLGPGHGGAGDPPVSAG